MLSAIGFPAPKDSSAKPRGGIEEVFSINFIRAHRLLAAAARQSEPRGAVTEHSECAQLEEMAAAGLIETTDRGTDANPSIYLERLTPLGHTFLRAFPEGMPRSKIPVATEERSASEKRADSCAAAVGKWRGKFAAMHLAEVRRPED